MSLADRLHYYRRIIRAYLVPGHSHLTFWHETPQMNPNTCVTEVGEYYMLFSEKADYEGHYDAAGIPMLDYHGRVGLQYNPIAIAQWGLGNYNLYSRTRDSRHKKKFLAAADWLCSRLELNRFGIPVWNHHFDWEYRSPLKAPWYSSLAQGQGVSLLVRTYKETKSQCYLDFATRAFESFMKSTDKGGVAFTDDRGDLWFEEYIVSPPTHILNGFIWAAWGVHDYSLVAKDSSAALLFAKAVRTLRNNLKHYDLGFWSLYELSGTRLPMVASPFYQQLHIVQLHTMYVLTGDEVFAHYANRWQAYADSRIKRTRALCYKSAFKLCYY
jgi:heparosan-N-sulfate-glucuronate 5-epimerase